MPAPDANASPSEDSTHPAHAPAAATLATASTDSQTDVDLAIMGAGIVGAAVACFAAPHARVLLLEAEAAAGFHATGRSAALYAASYGPPQVRALTRASRSFFVAPPAGLADDVTLLTPRGALFVATEAERASALSFLDTLRADGADAQWLEGDEVRLRVPVLRESASACGVFEADAFNIDVHALLQGYLRLARRAGATLMTDARVAGLRHDGTRWRITLHDGQMLHARRLVNAAGAWADEVARLAGARGVSLEPRRRAAFTFAPPAGLDVSGWPAVIALDESWYLKPDAGVLLGSPANADPAPPHDVRPEELDIALGIHRIEAATTLTIRRPLATWAGLRSFVPDGEPVAGFDPEVPDFVWAAALGGYGIQSSPAFGALVAAMATDRAPPPEVMAEGVELACLRPDRGSLKG